MHLPHAVYYQFINLLNEIPELRGTFNCWSGESSCKISTNSCATLTDSIWSKYVFKLSHFDGVKNTHAYVPLSSFSMENASGECVLQIYKKDNDNKHIGLGSLFTQQFKAKFAH